jgi:Na+/melibiose symporter-like transporter
MYIALQAGGLLLGILFIYFYPLTRQRCEAINEEISKRKEGKQDKENHEA